MRSRRERISWRPEWTKEYQKWSLSFNRCNKWRCDRVLDEDDLMQEAWFIFKHICDKYPLVVDANYFLALFKRAMINKMHDRSCRVKRRKGTVEAPISVDVYEVFSGRMGEMTNNGYLTTLLNEAPEELKLALVMAISAPEPVKPRKKLEPRESLASRAAKLFGGDPIGDLKTLLA